MQTLPQKQKSHEIFRFHGIFWCRNAIQIRTISLGCNFCRFSKGDGLCSFFIVEGYQNLIVIQVNRIDERIHQCLPLVFQAHVQLAKPKEPEPDELFGYFRLCQLFFRNAGFKLTLGFFELLQPFLGGTGQDARLNCIEHILDTRFRIPELLLIKRDVGVFLILQLHNLGDDGFHGGIVLDKLHGLVHHQIFQPLFTDSLFLAALVLFGSSTFIIAVDFSRPARTAFAKHQRPAVTTVQLGGEQIVVLCLSSGGGFLVFQHFLLHIIEKFHRHDRWNRIGNQDITVFQLTNIAAVAQHMLDGVKGHRPATLVLDALFVQPVPDLPHGLTIVIPLKRFRYERRSQRVDFKTAVGIDGVSKRDCTAVVLALEGIFALTARYFQGKFSGIVFRHANQHTLHHNAFRPLRNGFHGRHQMNTVLFQLVLVVHGIKPIPGKAVKFPDQNHIEDFLRAVLYHPLEVWAVIRFGRVGSVDVGADHGDTVLLGVVPAVAQLPFNGCFALAVRRIAGVDYSGHGKHLTLHIIKRRTVLSKCSFV